MIKQLCRIPIGMLGVCVVAGVLVNGALAESERATAIWPAESNARCQTYAGNKDIVEMTVSNQDLLTLSDNKGTGAGVIGPDDPSNPDGAQETLNWDVTLTNDVVTAISFTASTTVNYSILTRSGTGQIAIYPAPGVEMDTVSFADNGAIQKMSACYGLEGQERQTTGIEYPRCGLTSPIDGVGVDCPTNGDESLVCNIEVSEADGGINDGSLCCWCNVDPETVVTCDSPETCVDENGELLLNTYTVGSGQLGFEWTGDNSCGWFYSGTKKYWTCR